MAKFGKKVDTKWGPMMKIQKSWIQKNKEIAKKKVTQKKVVAKKKAIAKKTKNTLKAKAIGK